MFRGKTRSLLQKIHLTIGLGFGGVFMLLGLTGSAIAWLHEIDRMLNPELLRVAAVPGVNTDSLAPVTSVKVEDLIDRLTADPQYGRPMQLMLPEHADDVFVAWYRKQPPANDSLLAMEISRQVMVNPYTLQVSGERNWGELGISRRLLMPTIFHLHRYLAAGEFGKTVIGVAGLMLVLAAITGIVLWWPKPNLQALRRALSISRRGLWTGFNYSFHRAAGFFVAPVLLVLGFSGWYFNLPKWVTPLVSSVATVTPPGRPGNRVPHGGMQISPGRAMQAAQTLFPDARISRITLPLRPSEPYEIRLRQADEIRKGDGATRITIDAFSGEALQVRDPLRAPGGDRFLNWLFPLHSGEAFGTAGRIFISCFGVVPLLFLLTGLGIYLKRKN